MRAKPGWGCLALTGAGTRTLGHQRGWCCVGLVEFLMPRAQDEPGSKAVSVVVPISQEKTPRPKRGPVVPALPRAGTWPSAHPPLSRLSRKGCPAATCLLHPKGLPTPSALSQLLGELGSHGMGVTVTSSPGLGPHELLS